METSLSFTTLICHTSTRLLIQETVLPALHSSRGVFNVFDRRLPATVIAGGFLSLGNKLAKNGRLEMDSEHMNNPNIALIFVSFFPSWPWCQKRKPSWRKRLPSWSRVPQKWQSKIILPVRKWIYKRSVYHWLFSIVCFWIRVASQQGPERTCDGSASIPPWPPKLLTHGDIYIGLHGHTEILKNVISIHQVRLASWCGIPKVVRPSASSQAFCALSRSLRLKGYWILSQGWSPISTCLELKL